MLIRSHRFEFDAPDSWEADQDSGRLTFRGPHNEELILSGSYLTGSDPSGVMENLTKQLLENAKKGMRAAAEHPDLRMIWDVRRDESIAQIECWTTHAETKDRQTLFAQAAVVQPGAVMVITFEAPNHLESHTVLTKLLRSVRPITPN